MKCPACNKDAIVVNGAFESPVGTDEVTLKQVYVCTNTKCTNYSGTDLNNPKKVVTTKQVKVN